MKPLAIFTLAFATLLSLSACGPKKVRVQPTAADKPKDELRTNQPSLPPDGGNPDGPDDGPKVKGDEVIPRPPEPVERPKYGIKIEGKPNQIKSPYDPQGRPIDVRGLPPGTEIECPFTPGRHLLVP